MKDDRGVVQTKVNEYLVKVSAGAMPIEHELQLGDDVVLKVEGTVVTVLDKDLQDGTVDRVYTIKGVLVSQI